MAVAGLQVGEAVEGTPQGSGSVDALVVGQPVGGQGLAQHLDDPLHGSLQLGVGRARVAVGGRIQAGMVDDHGPPCAAHRPDGVVARQPHGGRAQTVGEDLTTPQAQRPDQRVVVVYVAVQGRLSDAEAFGHPGQGDGIQPLGVSQLGCAVHHLVGVESSPAHVRILVLETLTCLL